jgi:hypothetical protein
MVRESFIDPFTDGDVVRSKPSISYIFYYIGECWFQQRQFD